MKQMKRAALTLMLVLLVLPMAAVARRVRRR